MEAGPEGTESTPGVCVIGEGFEMKRGRNDGLAIDRAGLENAGDGFYGLGLRTGGGSIKSRSHRGISLTLPFANSMGLSGR